MDYREMNSGFVSKMTPLQKDLKQLGIRFFIEVLFLVHELGPRAGYTSWVHELVPRAGSKRIRLPIL